MTSTPVTPVAGSVTRPRRIWGGVVLWAAGATLASGAVAATPAGWALAVEGVGLALIAWALRPAEQAGAREILLAGARFLPLAAGLAALARVLELLLALATAGSHAAGFLAAPVFVLLEAAGAPVSLDGGTIHLQTMRDVFPFPITWEKLGLLPGALVVAGGTVLVFVSGRERRGRAIGALVAAVGAALVLRLALLVLVFHELMLHIGHDSETNLASLFWSPVATAVSLAPLAALLERAVPLAAPRARAPAPAALPGGAPARRAARARLRLATRARLRLATALAAACLIGAAGFHDPGRLKPGRVLVDEGHSQWERIDRPYDTEWYGAESGYNYGCIIDYLGRFFDVASTRKALTASRLAGCDVLILKIPTRRFEPEEVAAIRAWVEGGGGLFLIGDHTNVFGSGVYLNQVAAPLGFRFRYDCVFDIRHPFEQRYRRPRWLGHPVVRDLPPFLFATSCSLEPTRLPFEPVILAGGLKALPIDYSSSNFYPQVLDSPRMEFGVFLQMIGRAVGRGRVLGFTDSTVFSNFAAFHPGKAELFLASIEWLMRENRWRGMNAALGLAGLLALGLAGREWRRAARPAGEVLLVALAAGTAAAALLGALDRAAYAAPAPRRPLHRVAFSSEHTRMPAPAMGSSGDQAREFSIFYQWVQRLGYFPVMEGRGGTSGPEPDLRVIVYPVGEVEPERLAELGRAVRRGSRLLVIDGPENVGSSAGAWLRPFGLDCEQGRVVQVGEIADAAGRPLARGGGLTAWPVRGGEVLFTDGASGEPIGAVTRAGEGEVAFLGFASAFSDAGMGGSQSATPDPELRRLFELEFGLLRRLVEQDGIATAATATPAASP